MKTWTLKVSEDELKALIDFHKQNTEYDPNISFRIHDLTKRLNNKDKVEMIEKDEPIPSTNTGW
jgi:hypothetical protein